MWLAKVGNKRISEVQDPEITFERAMETYLKIGYSTNWINQRLKSISPQGADGRMGNPWYKKGAGICDTN